MAIKRYDIEWRTEDGQDLWIENDPQYINTQAIDSSSLSGYNLKTSDIVFYEVTNRLEVNENDPEGDTAFLISSIKDLNLSVSTEVMITTLGVAAYESIEKDEDYSDHEIIMDLRKKNLEKLSDILFDRNNVLLEGTQSEYISELAYNNETYAIVNGAIVGSNYNVMLNNIVTATDLNKAKTPSRFLMQVKNKLIEITLSELQVTRNLPGGLTNASGKIEVIRETIGEALEPAYVPDNVLDIEKLVESQMSIIVSKKTAQDAISFLDDLGF